MSDHNSKSSARKWAQFLAIAALVTTTPFCRPQLEGSSKWTAMSNTAYAITGDIKSTPTSLMIAGHRLDLRLVRQFDHDDLVNASEIFTTKFTPNLTGGLYQTHLSASTTLLGRNTLCGKKDTTWIVILVSQSSTPSRAGELYLAPFSGLKGPDLSPSVVATSSDLCGTYLFERSNVLER
jgi:hypothetical protein